MGAGLDAVPSWVLARSVTGVSPPMVEPLPGHGWRRADDPVGAPR